MSASPARRWQRLERDERREQILACARKLFSARNYASVSTGDIANAAGVARGLLHHYFGTKRELYLEVVRELMQTPSSPVPLPAEGRGLEAVLDESVQRWLTMLERNRGTWLAAIGAGGLGRDREVEAIMEEAREHAADRLIEALQAAGGPPETPALRAVVRSYSGLAEAASVQWLEQRRLSREQIRTLLVQAFLSIVRQVVPAVSSAG